MLAKGGSEASKQQAAQLEAQQRIQADNVGHRMLQVGAALDAALPPPRVTAHAPGA